MNSRETSSDFDEEEREEAEGKRSGDPVHQGRNEKMRRDPSLKRAASGSREGQREDPGACDAQPA